MDSDKSPFEKFKDRWVEEIEKVESMEEGLDNKSYNLFLDNFNADKLDAIDSMIHDAPDQIKTKKQDILLLQSKVITSLRRSNVKYHKQNPNQLMKFFIIIRDIIFGILGLLTSWQRKSGKE